MLNKNESIKYNQDMRQEVTNSCSIKAYDETMLACSLNLTESIILSALIDMHRIRPYKPTIQASIRDIREFIANSFSANTVKKCLESITGKNLITKHSSGLERGEFTIHYDEILRKAREYQAKQ